VAVIPYAEIDTVFLDVGNTLISIDFERIAAELAARGLACEPDALRRAEASARPGYSELVFVGGRSTSPGQGVAPERSHYLAYLQAIFEKVHILARYPSADLERLVAELGPILRPGGRANVLWRSVMPDVPEALDRLRRRGLTLGVVSNSDGTVEQSLETAGLLPYLSVVIDSAIVGVEKPDARIFELALARCGARPERTLHIGDIYHADVTGARAAGLHALLLDPFDDWPPIDCERAPDLAAVADRFERAGLIGAS
jgi:FMN phosphatase YigB (HAD superfamily)